MFLSQDFETVNRLGVSAGLEDFIELLLENRRFAEGPERLILVAENDVVEDGCRDAKVLGDLLVQLTSL